MMLMNLRAKYVDFAMWHIAVQTCGYEAGDITLCTGETGVKANCEHAPCKVKVVIYQITFLMLGLDINVNVAFPGVRYHGTVL